MKKRILKKSHETGLKGGMLFFALFAVFSLITPYSSLLTEVVAAPLTEESALELGGNKAQQQGNEGPALFTSLVKLFSGLAIVIGVMLVIYYFVRERLGKINSVSGKGRVIKVLATHYLAPKKAVMVIDVAGECLIVGVGEEINLLARLGDSTVGEDGDTPVQSRKPDFTEVLKAAGEGSTGVIDSIKERLERLKGKR